MASAIQPVLHVEVRSVRAEDVAAIAAIDGQARGRAPSRSWADWLRPYLAGRGGQRAPWGQVGLVDGQVVGFLLGEVRSEEFDLPPCGWIVTIGVHPAARGQYVGRALMERFLDYLAGRGITTVRTMVAWDNTDLLSFFGSLGFDCGPELTLEKALAPRSAQHATPTTHEERA